jgi:hypothetical protein
MQQRTICLWRLAVAVASGGDRLGAAAVLPVLPVRAARRRAGARVVVDLLRLRGKPVLAIDRPTGISARPINILMISVAWNGMGIPLIWMLLLSAGNSTTSERTELLDCLRAAFQTSRSRR